MKMPQNFLRNDLNTFHEKFRNSHSEVGTGNENRTVSAPKERTRNEISKNKTEKITNLVHQSSDEGDKNPIQGWAMRSISPVFLRKRFEFSSCNSVTKLKYLIEKLNE